MEKMLGCRRVAGPPACLPCVFFYFFHLYSQVLLVHGHWFYYRLVLLVHYFFYKNVACFAGILFYCFYNNFSIQPLYDSINLTFYNIIWTSAPIFVFALLEQNLSKKQLMRNPVFYRRIRQVPFSPLFSHSLYSFSKMFAEPDDEEKRVFPLVLHRSLARGRYILWMGKSVNLF